MHTLTSPALPAVSESVTTPAMPAKHRIRPLCTFTLDPDLVVGLKKLKERDGVAESETVRRALRTWLERKGVIRRGGPKSTTRTKTGQPAGARTRR